MKKVKEAKSQTEKIKNTIAKMLKVKNVKSLSDKTSNYGRVKSIKAKRIFQQVKLHLVGWVD